MNALFKLIHLEHSEEDYEYVREEVSRRSIPKDAIDFIHTEISLQIKKYEQERVLNQLREYPAFEDSWEGYVTSLWLRAKTEMLKQLPHTGTNPIWYVRGSERVV